MGDIIQFLEAEQEYYRQGAELISQTLAIFADVPRSPRSGMARAPIMLRSNSLPRTRSLSGGDIAATASNNTSNDRLSQSNGIGNGLRYASQAGALVFPTADGHVPPPKRINTGKQRERAGWWFRWFILHYPPTTKSPCRLDPLDYDKSKPYLISRLKDPVN